ncbi:MAG: metallopeptidase family protein [Desulfuromonadales bacterium]|nr:metallopeptidase family protein [Desulfuromonadales bacterium]NIS42761.1 metallopeptidase family protein [Desulfuromonadales bacterium]
MIEEEARATSLSLEQVARETAWHEIAHYSGFSEDEMDRIEESWTCDRSSR